RERESEREREREGRNMRSLKAFSSHAHYRPLVEALGGCERHENAGILIDDTHEQVIDVLLQLHNLLISLGELILLLDHKGDELLLSELGVGATVCKLLGVGGRGENIEHGEREREGDDEERERSGSMSPEKRVMT